MPRRTSALNLVKKAIKSGDLKGDNLTEALKQLTRLELQDAENKHRTKKQEKRERKDILRPERTNQSTAAPNRGAYAGYNQAVCDGFEQTFAEWIEASCPIGPNEEKNRLARIAAMSPETRAHCEDFKKLFITTKGLI